MLDTHAVARKYDRGELHRDIDESGAEGFWDLARELATIGVPDTFSDSEVAEQEEELEERQEAIYNALLDAYEHKDTNMDNIYNPEICPSSLDEYGEPMTEGETAHKWDESENPITCAECGAAKE